MAKFLSDTRLVVRSYVRSIESSDLGSFAVLGGLVIIGIIFQIANHNFLTPLNLANLMAQISAIGILSVGIVLILLIGEIDLSVGAVSGATAAVMAVLATTYHVPSILAILIAILMGVLIGASHGYFVAKIHVPSFVVTLSGLLVWQGVQLLVLGDTGTINLRDPTIRAYCQYPGPNLVGVADRDRCSITGNLQHLQRKTQARTGRFEFAADVNGCQPAAAHLAGDIGRHWNYEYRSQPGAARRTDPRHTILRSNIPRFCGSVPPHHALHRVWPPYLHGWRKCRGCQASEHRRRRGPHLGFRPLLRNCRLWRHRFRFSSDCSELWLRRWNHFVKRDCRRGDRRYQPVRRTREHLVCIAGGFGHRLDQQRHGPLVFPFFH